MPASVREGERERRRPNPTRIAQRGTPHEGETKQPRREDDVAVGGEAAGEAGSHLRGRNDDIVHGTGVHLGLGADTKHAMQCLGRHRSG